MKTRHWLFAFCCWLSAAGWPLYVIGQSLLPDRYNVSFLGLGEGLPHNNVSDIFADSNGFIWVCTYGGGLTRYDGYGFMTPLKVDAAGLPSRSCRHVAEDAFQRLWVTFDEGTSVIDLHTMTSVIPQYSDSTVSRLLGETAVHVVRDAVGNMWLVTWQKVYKFTLDSDGNVLRVSSYKYIGNTPDVTVRDVEGNGTAWLNIDGGLYRLVEKGNTLVREEISPVLRQLHGYYITDIVRRNNKVWIASNEGLFAYEPYTQQLEHYVHSSEPHTLSHNYVTSLAVTTEGRLVVGTLCGVNVLEEERGVFSHWTTASSRFPLVSDFVRCMFFSNGLLWIGTETGGIVKLVPRQLQLVNYTHSPAQPESLSPNPVNAMYVEADGTLWVGTVEGGLNRMAPHTQHFEHITSQTSSLSHNSVSVLVSDPSHRLWIGTWGGGINVLDLQSSAKNSLQPIVPQPSSLIPLISYIGAMIYDELNDVLWIGSNDGLFLYHPSTGQFENPVEKNREIRGCIGAYIDHEQQLWLGCTSGLRVIDLKQRDPASKKFPMRELRYKLDHPESGIIEKICCFCETADGTLWLGSNGYGIYRRQITADGDEHFECLTSDEGLANNCVKGIVEDRQHRLWITTDNGLSVFDPHKRTFINYKESDGLLSSQFYWNSIIQGDDGTLYLGTKRGLTVLKSQDSELQRGVNLHFTRLTVDNQEVYAGSDFLRDDISMADVVHLSESNRSITIAFSALNYTGNTQGVYSYRMRGLDNDWTILKSGEHSVRYSALPSGSYTFEVRYVPLSDDAEEQTLSLEIDVSPFFWKSWWFLTLLVLLITVVAIYMYKRRVEELKRREAEKLLNPIRKVLEESDNPSHLQTRIKNILDNHERLRESMNKNVEADKQALLLQQKPFMDRVMELMEQNYESSDFGVTEFCEAIGMSRSVVSKRLNEETGQSTGQFIRAYRLNIAKELLVKNNGNRNITEIAYKVGFNDPKYFTRCFTKMYGVSPSTYIEESVAEDK